MTVYTAIVTQSEPGWSIYVPEVDRHTYAEHLREIKPMARDLVQVMTNLPLDDIEVTIQLPADLASAIATMRHTRAGVSAAEAAAREAQRSAATALRKAGAPLRDIAVALGISHQRVHQVLEEAETRGRQLEAFREAVNAGIALNDVGLPVTGNDGGHPVICALADELVSKLSERIQSVGGYANVFVKEGERVRFVAVLDDACAIREPDDKMIGGEAPGATATIGMLLDYVERMPNGVTISAALGHPACARDARQVELARA